MIWSKLSRDVEFGSMKSTHLVGNTWSLCRSFHACLHDRESGFEHIGVSTPIFCITIYFQRLCWCRFGIGTAKNTLAIVHASRRISIALWEGPPFFIMQPQIMPKYHMHGVQEVFGIAFSEIAHDLQFISLYGSLMGANGKSKSRFKFSSGRKKLKRNHE